jgi:hypothetical protein
MEVFPENVQRQIDDLTYAFETTLGDNLIGIYLHGSLAMGCFNPGMSDIDLLVRVREPLAGKIRATLVERLVCISGNPTPIELSALSDQDLFPWRYPIPFTLHFSEDWRPQLEADRYWPRNIEQMTDPDLAAHITLLHARGISVSGMPIANAFPEVPPEHCRDSLLRDYDWALERFDSNPAYAILNTLRLLRYLTDGAITSKREAGEWALHTLPAGIHLPITEALAWYTGQKSRFDLTRDEVRQFVVETGGLIRLRACGGHEGEHGR